MMASKPRLVWGGVAALLIILAFVMHAFRYVPIDYRTERGEAYVTVWDRWLHRTCVHSLVAEEWACR